MLDGIASNQQRSRPRDMRIDPLVPSIDCRIRGENEHTRLGQMPQDRILVKGADAFYGAIGGGLAVLGRRT